MNRFPKRQIFGLTFGGAHNTLRIYKMHLYGTRYLPSFGNLCFFEAFQKFDAERNAGYSGKKIRRGLRNLQT